MAKEDYKICPNCKTNYIEISDKLCPVCLPSDKVKKASNDISKSKSRPKPKTKSKKVEAFEKEEKEMTELDKKGEKVAEILAKKFKKIQILDEDDLFQEGRIKAFEAKDSFDESKGFKFETFMSQVIKWHFISLARKEALRMSSGDSDGYDEDVAIGNTSEKTNLMKEITEFMASYFNQDEREIFFADYEGYSHEEIAKKFGKKKSQIDTIVQKVRNTIVEKFKKIYTEICSK